MNSSSLMPYVPRLVVDWLQDHDTETHRCLAGTLAFVDISGFTALTERLARKGHVGAEEMSDALNATFGHLIEVADRQGADLVKWGGDAVLLMFEGPGHAARACAAAYDMRARLRKVGHLSTTAGRIDLRMSVGIHSGDFHYFLVGDPDLHRELLVTGPAASETARLEGVANAGQVVVSSATAALLDEEAVGEQVDPHGWLLRRRPKGADAQDETRTTEPLVDVGQVLPVAIREHLVTGPGMPEHRTIAVAFVQFAGTDALLTEEGPEVTAGALDDCIQNVSQAAAAHGVTFFETDINADGGKIMLTAGAPRTAGHDADRLLRTARQILDRQGRLPLRIGVNTGHVFSGDFGPPFRRTYSVKGDAINLAARIMGKAAPGQLLATWAAHDHAETAFETTPVGPFTLKGKAVPVAAVAIGAITVGTPRREQRENPLVGRDQEMAVLREVLDAARAGRGGVVQLLGEPGIGKSRLVDELTGSARDAVVHTMVCDEYESSTPYAAFRDLLRELFDVDEHAPAEATAQVLSSRVREVAPRLLDWLPLLGDVLGLEVPETPATADLDDEFRKARLEAVVLDLLRAVWSGLTVVAVDDAQHMDAASADLLNGLATDAQERPWMVVVGRRDQPVGWVPADDLDSVRLRLGPLRPDDAMRLALTAAGDRALPRPTLAALAQKAGGNPLFLQSLVTQAGPAGGIGSLPESIEDVVAAQIDRLTSAQRSVLRHAAVLGSQFEVSELAALVPELAQTLDDHLRDGLAEFLVLADGTDELRFRHGLVREVAYQGLAYRARRRMHDQVGLAMERTQSSTRPALLSFHFLNAGRYDKAWSYARAAGEQARRMYANTEATELLGRAVEAARRLPRGTIPEREVGLVLESLGDCWFTIGLTDTAGDAYRQAHRHVRSDIYESARVVAKLATVEQRLRKFPQAMGRLRRELRAFEGLEGPAVHQARSTLLRRYAISRAQQGRMEEAIACGSEAVVEAESSADAETMGTAYANLHLMYLMAGQESDRALGDLALRAYAEVDDLAGQAQSSNNLAIEAHRDNRWDEAATMFGRAAELYRRIGDTDNGGIATCNRAEVLVNQAYFDEAAPLLDDALETGRSVSDEELVAMVLREQGRALSRNGNPDGGLVLLEEARARFETIDAPDEAVLTDVAIAESTLLRGDAEAAVRQTTVLLEEAAASDREAELHALRGLALLLSGRDLEADEELRRGATSEASAQNRFGYALSCLSLSRTQAADAATWAELGTAALAELGVVAVPLLDALPS